MYGPFITGPYGSSTYNKSLEPTDFDKTAIELQYGTTEEQKSIPGGSNRYTSLFRWHPLDIHLERVKWFPPAARAMCQFPWLVFFKHVPELRLYEIGGRVAQVERPGRTASVPRKYVKFTRGPPFPFMLAFTFVLEGTPFLAAHTRHFRIYPERIAAVKAKFGDTPLSRDRFTIRRGQYSVEGMLAQLTLAMAVRGDLDVSAVTSIAVAIDANSPVGRFINEAVKRGGGGGGEENNKVNRSSRTSYDHEWCVTDIENLYDYEGLRQSRGSKQKAWFETVAGDGANPNVKLALHVFLHKYNFGGANFDMCKLIHFHIPKYLQDYENTITSPHAPDVSDEALVECVASAILGKTTYNDLRLHEAIVNRVTRPMVAPPRFDDVNLATRRNFVWFFLYSEQKGNVARSIFGTHATRRKVSVARVSDHYGSEELPLFKIPMDYVDGNAPASDHEFRHAENGAELEQNSRRLGPWFKALVNFTFLKLVGTGTRRMTHVRLGTTTGRLNKYSVVNRFIKSQRGGQSSDFVRRGHFFHYYDEEIMRAFLGNAIEHRVSSLPSSPRSLDAWFRHVLDAMAANDVAEIAYLTCTNSGDPFGIWATQSGPPFRLDHGDRHMWSVYDNVTKSGLTPELLRSNRVDPYEVLAIPHFK